MKRRPLARWAAICGMALAVILLAPTPVAAQLNQTLHDDGWILAAAHAPGYQGSIWRTDLWIRFERSGGSIDLTFCESGVDNTDAETFTLDTDVYGFYIEDVVDEYLDIGDGSWLGAIHYTASRGVQVYARVYSISPDGTRSFGQIIEGIPTSDMSMSYNHPDYPSTREDQWMFPVKHTADGRFRVNVGAVNPTAVETQVHFQIFDETGNNPPDNTSYTETIPPYSMLQLNDPFATVNGGDWSIYVIRVEAVHEDAGVLAYASAVDNATNDAFFVRGTQLFRPDD
jgi:hypothetical protein